MGQAINQIEAHIEVVIEPAIPREYWLGNKHQDYFLSISTLRLLVTEKTPLTALARTPAKSLSP